MIATLISLGFSGAWALVKGRTVQAVAGPFAKAIAAGIAAFVLVLGIGCGIWWLRSDARYDERAQCVREYQEAEMIALRNLQKRVTASEKIAAEYRELIDAGNLAAKTRIGELEAELARTPRNVAYPANIAKRLSQ